MAQVAPGSVWITKVASAEATMGEVNETTSSRKAGCGVAVGTNGAVVGVGKAGCGVTVGTTGAVVGVKIRLGVLVMDNTAVGVDCGAATLFEAGRRPSVTSAQQPNITTPNKPISPKRRFLFLIDHSFALSRETVTPVNYPPGVAASPDKTNQTDWKGIE